MPESKSMTLGAGSSRPIAISAVGLLTLTVAIVAVLPGSWRDMGSGAQITGKLSAAVTWSIGVFIAIVYTVRFVDLDLRTPSARRAFEITTRRLGLLNVAALASMAVTLAILLIDGVDPTFWLTLFVYPVVLCVTGWRLNRHKPLCDPADEEWYASLNRSVLHLVPTSRPTVVEKGSVSLCEHDAVGQLSVDP